MGLIGYVTFSFVARILKTLTHDLIAAECKFHASGGLAGSSQIGVEVPLMYHLFHD